MFRLRPAIRPVFFYQPGNVDNYPVPKSKFVLMIGVSVDYHLPFRVMMHLC
jgi:hypothetical protein